jgi:hypothetical protein
MSATQEDLQHGMPGWLKYSVIAIGVAVVIGALWQLLPRSSFSNDLSRVGQGTPALVMLREVHIMGGEQVMDMMQAIYPDYEQQVIFLVVQTGHPDGVAFSDTYGIRDGGLVLFDAAGNVIDRSARPESTEALRNLVDRAL